ncbi:MAG TPA: DUF4254 domain-containing protein [Chitinophagaceae bacterium]
MASITAQHSYQIFEQSIIDYHRLDNIDASISNPYTADSPEHLLYLKNWIDTVQWHLEDVIRDPAIDPIKALEIKRRIDASNQQRTDMVEFIDNWLLQQNAAVKANGDATLNTETPAWAFDRLSILALKIYHMNIEATREDASAEHRKTCEQKLDILLVQRKDLSLAIDQLLDDIANGRKYMKLYKQMKMYNDASLNPVLYQLKK